MKYKFFAIPARHPELAEVFLVPTFRRGNSSSNAPALRDAGASPAAFPRWSVGTRYNARRVAALSMIPWHDDLNA